MLVQLLLISRAVSSYKSDQRQECTANGDCSEEVEMMNVSLVQMSAAAGSGEKSGKSIRDALRPRTAEQDDAVDVVVVGSGLSGLTAALEMEKYNLTVQVLEAMPRLGGRMHREVFSPKQSVDIGGQWVGRTHLNLMALCDRLNLRRFISPNMSDGFSIRFDDETIDLSLQGIGSMFMRGFNKSEIVEGTEALLDAYACDEKFMELASTLPAKKYPFELTEEFEMFDKMSIFQWVSQNTQTELGRFICLFPHSAGGSGTDGVDDSLLNRLWNKKNSNQDDDPEYELIEGGAGQIPELLADELVRPVRLGDPVVEIKQADSKATVLTLQGKVYTAKDVVVAVPPAVSGKIKYDPPLPYNRQQLHTKIPMGTIVKILLIYAEAFWVNSSTISQHQAWMIANKKAGMLSVIADSSDPLSDVAHLVILITGSQADQYAALSTEEQRKDAVLSELATVVGDKALSPLAFYVGDWVANPWVSGSYGYVGLDGWTRWGSGLVEPHGCIQWASTETAREWSGYFEGAILSGKEAARKVVEGEKGADPSKIPSADLPLDA